MSIISRTAIIAIALTFALAAGEVTAYAKGHKKKSGVERQVKGTVTAASKDSITVETKKHGSKQFRITSGTTIEKIGKHGTAKSGKSGKSGKRTKIKSGTRVVVTPKGDTAQKVGIKKKGHKGKNK